jgi:hypothetical protein
MPAAIKAITIGKGDKAITVGGETCYPFYQFEGDMPNKPKDRHGDLGHGTRGVAGSGNGTLQRRVSRIRPHGPKNALRNTAPK